MTLVPCCGRFLPCLRAVLCDPIRSLCVAGAIFFDASEHFLWFHLLFVWQVQIIGDNGDPTFFLCGRCNIFDASGKFLVTLFLFCVAGALVTRPPRSTLWPHVLFVWQVLYVRCLREVLVTWTQGSLGTPPPFFVWQVQYFLMPPRSSAGCDPTSFLCGMCNNFAAFWPYPPPWKSRKWLTPCLREGPPGRLRVGSQATTTPHNSSDHVILRICFLRRHVMIFAWHGLCPASKV